MAVMGLPQQFTFGDSTMWDFAWRWPRQSYIILLLDHFVGVDPQILKACQQCIEARLDVGCAAREVLDLQNWPGSIEDIAKRSPRQRVLPRELQLCLGHALPARIFMFP